MGIISQTHTSSDSNVVLADAKTAAFEHELRRKRFTFWNVAEDEGYRTRNQWRRKGHGVKGKAAAVIRWRGRDICLYHATQTTKLRERTKAALRLIDRFVVRPDVIVYKPFREDGWSQLDNSEWWWNLKELVRQGFNHVKCHDTGVRLTKDDKTAQAFAVRCKARTNFFAIDLDNHTPTADNIPVHLKLVELVQNHLPRLVELLHGGSIFYQYRQIDPTGIQCWVTLSWKVRIDSMIGLHEKVRQFLVELETRAPGLNRRLQEAGLATLDKIEILPTASKQISVPGCYGKTVFTTEELKLVKGRFDVMALDTHINNQVTTGQVLPRYQELVEVCWGSNFCPAGAEIVIPIQSDEAPTPPNQSRRPEIISLDGKVPDGSRYWTDLKRTALAGVTSPDNLYEDYLQPFAQCLFFRDFVRQPDRVQLVEEELFAWVLAKHNGLVSRLLTGKVAAIRRQCRQVAKKIEEKTCPAVKQFYKSILLKDALYPRQVEHLYDFMREGTASNEQAKRNTVGVIYCKCSISDSSDPIEPADRPVNDTPLPSKIDEKIRELAHSLRKGKVRDRFVMFARRFLNEIASGDRGRKSIGWQHINAMMDKPDLENRQTQGRYKTKLAEAGLISGEWEKFIRRNACSSKYRLTDWAFEEFRQRNGLLAAKSA